MNKKELITALADQLGGKNTAETALNAVLDTIKTTVAEGGNVKLPGFGVFERVERPARDARNPGTGAVIKVPATAVPKFKPGADFKDRVASKRTAGV